MDSHLLSRRSFAAASGIMLAGCRAKRPPQILLRNFWQTVNIGDIGHGPGALALFEEHFPKAEVTLWPRQIDAAARELVTRNYPRVKIVEGTLDAEGRPASAELARAWEAADIYVSGSGSGFPARTDAAAFQKTTGKPVGVFGVSTDPISGFGEGRDTEGGTLAQIHERGLALPPTHLEPATRDIINRAAFFFCRDTISRDYLKAQGTKEWLIEFGPDAQLGMTLRDDARGFAFLERHGLEQGKFICVIPRLRYTPYYRIRNVPRVPEDDIRDAINSRTTEQDHAKLRDMMASYVNATGNKVLACAEMTYQVEMAKQVLVDPLPPEVKRNVVWRDSFWLPDEAASVYSKALAVVSVECHSPLIALHNRTPAFYVRQPTDTCKGQMYRDFGAGDWFFEIDEATGPSLWSRLEAIHRDPAAAKAKADAIMAMVEGVQHRMVNAVERAIQPGSRATL